MPYILGVAARVSYGVLDDDAVVTHVVVLDRACHTGNGEGVLGAVVGDAVSQCVNSCEAGEHLDAVTDALLIGGCNYSLRRCRWSIVLDRYIFRNSILTPITIRQVQCY